ncbi:hypothetical protein SUDANB171_04530 [Streptomyces sp. enrichment culture]|uniref:DUF4328 domain-containing protein n=1 Tax=Streptomyces sp. enrichment culture TaxID=1795815 RepID=UPI003F580174
MNTPQCWNCWQQPAALPDGLCQPCAQAVPYPQRQPQGGPPYAGAPQGGPQPYPVPPGGPQPYHGAPPQPYPPHGPAHFADPQGLATAVTVLLGVCIAAWTVAVLAGGRLYGLLLDVEEGRFVSSSAADSADSFYTTSGILQTMAMLATAVVFIMWFYRVRVNAEVFDPYGQRMKRGWAVGGWLVPIVNFWFPKKIANDIWRASAPGGERQGTGVLTAWWVLWLITALLDRASFRTMNREEESFAEELSNMQQSVSTTLVSDVLGIVAAVLAIIVVRRLTQWQLVKYAQGPMPMPMPMATPHPPVTAPWPQQAPGTHGTPGTPPPPM